jgi:multiple sugar transport system substrate-binding protein
MAAAEPRLVLKLQPLWGDPAPFRALVAEFEREHRVQVVSEYLPNSSDLAHQFYLTALEGGATDFDVMVVDVVWAPEFARAGWAADLTAELPPAALAQTFLPGPVEAVVVDGRTWAVPWFVDVGLLYYRTDLVPRAPVTYAELESFATEAMAKDPSLSGYVWQGRQYEGLNCNVFEALWGHGGEALADDGRLGLQTAPMREALRWMRGLVSNGVSPAQVTSYAEEEARRVFGGGRAVFMRNWPYAWSESQKEGSSIRGKVGFGPLPTVDGRPGAGTLGGWQLAVNAHLPEDRRARAVALVRHLTSLEANVVMAVHYGRNPPRRDAYQDPRVREGAPFIAGLLPAVEAARPRPVSPWYMLVSDVLQGEFSAAISGIREPGAALDRAQNLSDHLMGVDR